MLEENSRLVSMRRRKMQSATVEFLRDSRIESLECIASEVSNFPVSSDFIRKELSPDRRMWAIIYKFSKKKKSFALTLRAHEKWVKSALREIVISTQYSTLLRRIERNLLYQQIRMFLIAHLRLAIDYIFY